MKRFILLLSILVFTYLAISACKDKIVERGAAVDQDREWIVEIKPVPGDKEKRIRVEQNVVRVQFGTNQSVTWVLKDFPSSNGPDFIINFNKHARPHESPFSSKTFGHGPGLNKNSGRAVVDPGPGKEERYDYLVTVPGYKPLDPGVIVWN